jgi:hypothetical protein
LDKCHGIKFCTYRIAKLIKQVYPKVHISWAALTGTKIYCFKLKCWILRYGSFRDLPLTVRVRVSTINPCKKLNGFFSFSIEICMYSKEYKIKQILMAKRSDPILDPDLMWIKSSGSYRISIHNTDSINILFLFFRYVRMQNYPFHNFSFLPTLSTSWKTSYFAARRGSQHTDTARFTVSYFTVLFFIFPFFSMIRLFLYLLTGIIVFFRF